MSKVAALSSPLLISSKHATEYSPITTSASVTRRRSPPLCVCVSNCGVGSVMVSPIQSVRATWIVWDGRIKKTGASRSRSLSYLTPRCVWSPMIVSEQLASPSRDITTLARSLAMARRTC